MTATLPLRFELEIYNQQELPMYVCLCKGVSERTVKACIREGAVSVGEVGRRCGAGTDCGACRGLIRDLIEESQETSARPSLPLPVPA